MKKVIKVIVTYIAITVCYVLCSVAFAFYLKTFEKSVAYGHEYIGLEYSAVLHQFGKEPDVVEKFSMNSTDQEFRNTFSSFIDSCNRKNHVIKFTYKRDAGDVTLWAFDNNKSVRIILAR